MREYDFPNNLRRILKDKKIPIRRFAKDFLISENTVANWLNGKHNPSIETFYDICDVLNVTPDELLFKKEDEPLQEHNNKDNEKDKRRGRRPKEIWQ